MGIHFPVAKIGEFAPLLDQLLRNENAFALVTAAHLLTQQTRRQPVKRFAAKSTLVPLLYERTWDRQRIIDLFSVIDWMMAVPHDLQDELLTNIGQLKRRLKMPYMNPFEKRGREQGREEGAREAARKILVIQLEKRFGKVSPRTMALLEQAKSDELLGWVAAAIDAPSIDQVFSPR